jgi:GrpB-like predicted nucleotidyltransferase (UPF0157 family)
VIDIVVVDYDPRWPVEYERESAALRAALGTVAERIDHVGSTSVPGLAAKPVIDIQVSVVGLADLDRYRAPLEACGYTFSPPPGGELDDYPYFFKPAAWPHTHHVHVCEAGSDVEWRQLAFPAWLRAHPDDARRYEAVKRTLAQQVWETGDDYANAKDEIVASILAAARQAWSR